MVQFRKPLERSDDLIDYRVGRSPRGSIPLSAAAMLKQKKEDREKMIREYLAAEAKLRALRARRG